MIFEFGIVITKLQAWDSNLYSFFPVNISWRTFLDLLVWCRWGWWHCPRQAQPYRAPKWSCWIHHPCFLRRRWNSLRQNHFERNTLVLFVLLLRLQSKAEAKTCASVFSDMDMTNAGNSYKVTAFYWFIIRSNEYKLSLGLIVPIELLTQSCIFRGKCSGSKHPTMSDGEEDWEQHNGTFCYTVTLSIKNRTKQYAYVYSELTNAGPQLQEG